MFANRLATKSSSRHNNRVLQLAFATRRTRNSSRRQQQQAQRQFSALLRPPVAVSVSNDAWGGPPRRKKNELLDYSRPLGCIRLPTTISVLPSTTFQHQRRCLSATATPPSNMSSSSSSSKRTHHSVDVDTENNDSKMHASSSSSNDNEDNDTNNNNNNTSKKDYRDRMRHTAGAARDQYKEFRDDPAAGARKGALKASDLLKMYGPVFVGTYLTVYGVTLGSLYLGVQSGVLDPVSLFGWLGQDTGAAKNTADIVVDFLNKYSVSAPYSSMVQEHPYLANLAVAWIANKFTEPVRLAMSVSVTPKVARYFGYGPAKIPKKEGVVDDDHGETETSAGEASETKSKATKQ